MQQAGRICHVLAGAARRRAVNRLEHRAVVADICRARQANGTGDLCGDVGEHVAVEIRHHDHVEGFGRIGHLGRADVDDPVLVLDLRVLGGDFVERPVEQAVRDLHDVVFGEARDFFALVGAGVLEGVADDAFAAGSRDQLEALRDLIGLAVLDAAIDVLFVLANDDDVHRRVFGRDVGIERHAGPNVGVHAERLADGNVEALEAAALRRRDRRLQKDLRAPQRFPGRRLDAVAQTLVVDRLADLDALELEPRSRGIEDSQRRGHDFRTDAVAVGDRDWRDRCRHRAATHRNFAYMYG